MVLQGGSNPLDSFFNSICVEIRYPLESTFNKLVQDFKNCFDGVMKNGNPSDYVYIEQLNVKKMKGLSAEHMKRLISDNLINFPTFKVGSIWHVNQFDNFKALSSNLHDNEEVFGGFLPNSKFARVRGGPGNAVEHVPTVKEIEEESVLNAANGEDGGDNRQQKLTKAMLSIPLFDCKRSLMELIELLSRIKRPLRKGRPDETKSVSMQDFFIYTEAAENAGSTASEDDDVALTRYPNDTKQSISYRKSHKFMLLLPSDQLQEGSRSIKSAVEIPPDSVLKSALAGGLSCALSASIMHPVDTIKTWVQASSTLTFPEVMSKLPQYGVRALYRGSIPAILGQFSSHGLRTGISEASKIVLVNIAPGLPPMQVESVTSFCGTFLGTAMRIPCEVLKQRLQAGLFENVGQAVVGTWREDGACGFFRGTTATLCREIPFYVAGMGLYAESKKAVGRLIKRELQPWERVAVGALSGGLTAVLTTPIDVIKTRMMIAGPGQTGTLSFIVLSILGQEGPIGLFKGAVPRFFWVAPLGAINFAGYELLRKAMG